MGAWGQHHEFETFANDTCVEVGFIVTLGVPFGGHWSAGGVVMRREGLGCCPVTVSWEFMCH